MAKPQASESAIQRKLLIILADKGWWAQKVVGQSRNGLPDLVAARNGKTIWIEVKKSNGKLRKVQTLEIENMVYHGCYVFIVYGLVGVRCFADNFEQEIGIAEKSKERPCWYYPPF